MRYRLPVPVLALMLATAAAGSARYPLNLDQNGKRSAFMPSHSYEPSGAMELGSATNHDGSGDIVPEDAKQQRSSDCCMSVEFRWSSELPTGTVADDNSTFDTLPGSAIYNQESVSSECGSLLLVGSGLIAMSLARRRNG